STHARAASTERAVDAAGLRERRAPIGARGVGRGRRGGRGGSGAEVLRGAAGVTNSDGSIVAEPSMTRRDGRRVLVCRAREHHYCACTPVEPTLGSAARAFVFARSFTHALGPDRARPRWEWPLLSLDHSPANP